MGSACEQMFPIINDICESLGFKMSDEKKTLPTKNIELLGTLVCLEDQLITVSVTEERKNEICNEITEYLERGSMSSGQAAKLRGKISFCEMSMFGKVGRATCMRW